MTATAPILISSASTADSTFKSRTNKVQHAAMAGQRATQSTQFRGYGMFDFSQMEEDLCNVLVAYIQEWGHENIIVHLPKTWDRSLAEIISDVRCEFTTDDSIDIQVAYLNATQYYSAPLASAWCS